MLSACGSPSYSYYPGALPPRQPSLLPRPLAGAPRGEFAVKVLHGPRHQALAFAAVRIDGHGPYPFMVDSGAAVSVIKASLARKLHLPSLRAPRGRLYGIGCGARGGKTRVQRWRAGRVALPSVELETLPSVGSSSRLDGLLGSDLWSRLGSLRLDYSSGRVTVGARAAGAAGRAVSIEVVHHSGEVVAVARVRVSGQGPFPFVIDTGASLSAVSGTLASRLGLRAGSSTEIRGINCTVTTHFVRLRRWRAGGVRLVPASAVSVQHMFGRSAEAGLIGSDELSEFTSITIEYSARRLVLSGRGR